MIIAGMYRYVNALCSGAGDFGPWVRVTRGEVRTVPGAGYAGKPRPAVI